MPTIEIKREFQFDAGHRILNHESKCKHLHGHRYRAEVHVTAPGLDSLGRVIDFGVIKERVGKWIDKNWDHNIVLSLDDPLAKIAQTRFDSGLSACESVNEIFGGKGPYLIQGNPTAENIAKELYGVAVDLIESPITVTKVIIHETPNCSATYRP